MSQAKRACTNVHVTNLGRTACLGALSLADTLNQKTHREMAMERWAKKENQRRSLYTPDFLCSPWKAALNFSSIGPATPLATPLALYGETEKELLMCPGYSDAATLDGLKLPRLSPTNRESAPVVVPVVLVFVIQADGVAESGFGDGEPPEVPTPVPFLSMCAPDARGAHASSWKGRSWLSVNTRHLERRCRYLRSCPLLFN